MNTLSSLPPPSFADLALRGATPPEARGFALPADGDGGLSLQVLHVGNVAQSWAPDDIERDFLAALCESTPSA
jgi:hypothetical protein